MKKDISANLNQKCSICSKVILNVLYNVSLPHRLSTTVSIETNPLYNLGLTILFPWQHTGLQTSPILKVFLATLCVQFSYLQILLIYMIQQAYKYVSLSLWPHTTFSELKITYILKSSGWGLERSDLRWQQNIL